MATQRKATQGKATQGKAYCTVCGKPLTGNKTCGALCAKRQANGQTNVSIAQRKQALSANVPPVGYIKVAQLHVICANNFVPIARMVKCIGGDRAMYPVAHAICTPVYVNNTRWVNGWLGTKAGLQAMLTGNFSTAPTTATTTATTNAKVK